MRYESFIRRMMLMGGVNALTASRGILLLPILTRLLGVKQYGLYSQFVIFLQVLLPFATFNLDAAILRFLAGKKEKRELQEGIYASLATAVLLAFLTAWMCLLLRPYLGGILGGEGTGGEISELFPLLLLILIFHAGSLLVIAFFRTTERHFWFAGLSLIDTFFYLFGAILLVYLGFSVKGVFYALLFSKFLIFSAGVLLLIRSIGISMPRFSVLPGYLRYCVPLLPSTFFYYVIQFSDRYVIVYFGTLQDVSQYNAAYTFGGIITLIFSPFFQLVIPRITALWNQGKKEQAASYLERSIKYTTALFVPVLCLCGLFAREMVEIYATREFVVGREVLLMIMGAYVFLMLGGFGVAVVALQKKTVKIFIIEGCAAVFNLLLNFALIPSMGIRGAALVTVLTFGIQFAVYAVWSRRILPHSFHIPFLLKTVVAGIGMVFCAMILDSLCQVRLPFSMAGGVLLYAVLLIAQKGFSRGEFATFSAAIFRRTPNGM